MITLHCVCGYKSFADLTLASGLNIESAISNATDYDDDGPIVGGISGVVACVNYFTGNINVFQCNKCKRMYFYDTWEVEAYSLYKLEKFIKTTRVNLINCSCGDSLIFDEGIAQFLFDNFLFDTDYIDELNELLVTNPDKVRPGEEYINNFKYKIYFCNKCSRAYCIDKHSKISVYGVEETRFNSSRHIIYT